MENYYLETINAKGHLGYVKEAWEHPNAVLYEETENIHNAKWMGLEEARDLALKNNGTCDSPNDVFFVVHLVEK